jgi:hypothetical protein
MTMKTFLCICLLTGLLAAGKGYAQGAYGIVSYQLGIPLGNTGDFVQNAVSPRGGGIEFGGFIGDRISLGIGGTWNVFYKNVGRVTLTEGNTTITGRQYRYHNLMPLYAMARYFFRPAAVKTLSPYAGVGAGALYGRMRMAVGLLSDAQQGWQLGLFPEAGVQYSLSQGTGVVLSGRYHHGFANDDLPATSYIGINLGLRFALR